MSKTKKTTEELLITTLQREYLNGLTSTETKAICKKKSTTQNDEPNTYIPEKWDYSQII